MGQACISMDKIVQDLKDEFFKTELEVGKIVNHPTHGKVKILSGQFWSGGRLSNFWEWQKVDDQGNVHGQKICGYGWM